MLQNFMTILWLIILNGKGEVGERKTRGKWQIM